MCIKYEVMAKIKNFLTKLLSEILDFSRHHTGKQKEQQKPMELVMIMIDHTYHAHQGHFCTLQGVSEL